MTLLLGIAYASNIGGVGTLIGTPPTALLAGVAEKSLGASISFASWMLVGVPVAFALLVITWLLLVRLTGPARLAPPELLREPWTPAQRRVAFILALTAALWVARPWLTALGADRGITALAGLTDAGIAVLAALSLFIVRGERGRQLMDWEGLSALPWGVLVLFGGGLALAGAMTETGLDTHLAGALGGLRGVPLWVACLCVAAIATFASELASNTAIASALLPVLAAAGATLSLDPMPLMVAGTLGASLAFMLPVGTPPNAMVYATGSHQGRRNGPDRPSPQLRGGHRHHPGQFGARAGGAPRPNPVRPTSVYSPGWTRRPLATPNVRSPCAWSPCRARPTSTARFSAA
jgi:sodium-dependent dicarboxylate transporter 2/3/5